MFSNYFKYVFFVLLFIVLIPILFIPMFSFSTNYNLQSKITLDKQKINISNSIFLWPIPGYTRISSYFGKRTAPTAGASSYHLGIDIPAPNGANIIAPINAKVIFVGFKGSGGYTIILEYEKLQLIYHHVSPEFTIKVGQQVYKGQIVGRVRT